MLFEDLHRPVSDRTCKGGRERLPVLNYNKFYLAGDKAILKITYNSRKIYTYLNLKKS